VINYHSISPTIRHKTIVIMILKPGEVLGFVSWLVKMAATGLPHG